MEKKLQHILMLISSAVKLGFEFDETDSMEEIYINAQDYIVENGEEEMTWNEFDRAGQSYNFCDADGFMYNASGEIFDFGYHYKASDCKLFRREGDNFVAVNWYDVPTEGKERENYLFVYDRVACADGKVAALFDYFA